MSQSHEGNRLLPTDSAWVRVVARRDGRCVELLVHGEADAQTNGQLRAELMSALDGGVSEVRVDLSGLSFCDVAGSDVLRDFTDEATARSIAIDLRGMSPLLTFLYTSLRPRPAEDRGAGAAAPGWGR